MKETLLYLLNELNEDDRIALISFNSHSKVLCDFTKVNMQSQPFLRDAIDALNAEGITDITAAMNDAFRLIS